MLEAFETKQLFGSLKLHFTTENFNAIRYNFKLKPPTEAAKLQFLRNNQRHLYAKVGRHPDPRGLIIANFLNNPKLYVTDLLSNEAEECYLDWKGRQGKLTYLLKEELERDELVHQITKVDQNGMPILLGAYIRKQVSPETIVIVDAFAHKLDEWATSEHPLVMKFILRLRKYRPFVIFDKNRARAVIRAALAGK